MATEKQESILAYLRTYETREGEPPSSRMVQQRFGFRTQTTVMRHFRALADEVLVEQLAGGRWRATATADRGDMTDIPVYGSIPAGLPAFREQQPEEMLPFDLRVLRTRGPLWAVRVQGDSMTGAHIAEGDIAILERREAHPGEIIAALVDEHATTLKRFLVVDGKPVLRAANEKYRDIFPETFECQGVLVAVFRRQAAGAR